MKKLLFIFAILFWLPIAHANEAEFERGHQAYVNRDYKTALSIFESLAEQGDAGGQNYLGWLYLKGHGVKKDYDKAAELYRMSAEQGNKWGHYNIGYMYSYGRGVEKSFIQAYMWASISLADNNNKENIRRVNSLLKRIKKKMTPEDIEQAESQAKQCIASYYRNCGE